MDFTFKNTPATTPQAKIKTTEKSKFSRAAFFNFLVYYNIFIKTLGCITSETILYKKAAKVKGKERRQDVNL